MTPNISEDAKIGRFIAPDPVRPVDPINSKTNEEMLLNTQKINLYAYGLNNPNKYVDLLGLAEVIVKDVKGNSRTFTNPGAKGLLNILEQYKDKSISRIEILGHGNTESLTLSEGKNSPDAIVDMGDKIILLQGDNIHEFTDLLNNKLANQAEVYLNGCNTASLSNNISKDLSKLLTGAIVTGDLGFGLSTHEINGK